MPCLGTVHGQRKPKEFYHYNRTSTYWALAGGGGDIGGVTTFSAGTTGLSPSTATSGAVTLGGTLAVANGGTGITSFGAANRIPFASSTTALTTSANLTFDETVLLLRKNSSGNTFSTLPNIAVENTNASSNSYASIGVKAGNNAVIGDILADGFGNIIAGGAVLFRTVTNHPFLLQTNATTRIIISASGNVKITNLTGSGSRAVNAAADGTLSASSSISIKENVNNLNYGLDKILQLQPKSFNYIDKNKYGEGLDIGFIAEDVYPIVPEATGTMNDGFIYFDAVKLIPILTKAIQEQQAQIEALKQRILILENK